VQLVLSAGLNALSLVDPGHLQPFLNALQEVSNPTRRSLLNFHLAGSMLRVTLPLLHLFTVAMSVRMLTGLCLSAGSEERWLLA
jgi:flagellar biosynthesis protein FliR